MKSIVEIADELALLQRYRYIVERYLAGLQRLTVVAYPMWDIQDTASPVFITFRTVKYIQMPTYWEEAPFILGTPNECRALLERIGIKIVKRLPHLFYAQLPKSRVYVVCGHVDISDTMPP
ncbi:MAG: hypothetical protein H5T62_07695 [Anaerolineae bacterium]|nr:hypothetical protein [Anaerolineae bacterium]